MDLEVPLITQITEYFSEDSYIILEIMNPVTTAGIQEYRKKYDGFL